MTSDDEILDYLENRRESKEEGDLDDNSLYGDDEETTQTFEIRKTRSGGKDVVEMALKDGREVRASVGVEEALTVLERSTDVQVTAVRGGNSIVQSAELGDVIAQVEADTETDRITNGTINSVVLDKLADDQAQRSRRSTGASDEDVHEAVSGSDSDDEDESEEEDEPETWEVDILYTGPDEVVNGVAVSHGFRANGLEETTLAYTEDEFVDFLQERYKFPDNEALEAKHNGKGAMRVGTATVKEGEGVRFTRHF